MPLDPDRLRAIQERLDAGWTLGDYGLAVDDTRYLLSLVSALTQERDKALAAQCDHEKCIQEMQARFDKTIDEALARAEQAEAERDRLRGTAGAEAEACNDAVHELDVCMERLKHAEAERDALARTLEQTEEAIVKAYGQAQDNWCAQCFDYSKAPENMRRNAHAVARDGLRELMTLLGTLARPVLRREWEQACAEAQSASNTPPEDQPGEHSS